MEHDLYRVLVDEARDALIAVSPEGRVAFWNRGAEELFGYRAVEAVGHLLVDLVVPSELQAEELALMREAAAGELATRESVRVRRDGERLVVSISTRAVWDEEGALRCFVTVKQDVTEQRALRDARIVEERFHDCFDAVPDAIVVINEAGRVVLFNEPAQGLFGYGRDEVLGRPVELLLPERFRHAHRSHRTHFSAAPRRRTMGGGLELAGLRKDGSEFPVDISLSPLRMDTGSQLVVSAIRDVTQQKRVERALHDKNVELELANKAKDRFLAAMSHELRTPLNAVIGFTNILLMRLPGPLLEEQERQLTLVEQSAQHLLALISDLLDIAKIDSQGADLTFEDCDLCELLRPLEAMFRPMAEARGLGIAVCLPAGGCRFRSDRRALRQIVINLLSNALKFTREGRVELVLARAGDDVEISVSDTGVGIGEADLPHLFEPFMRLGDSAQLTEGTGLGLYLSRKLVERMHGQLRVESRAGAGSRFTVALSAHAS
jgi:PAS domain S-box-containing protein